MKTQELELRLATFFDFRRNLIVPRIAPGLVIPYEADLIIVTPSRWATEVEIKISASDIRAESKKSPWAHRSENIKKFYYAVPEDLADCKYLPQDCGLISVMENPGKYDLVCEIIRPPKINKEAAKITDAQYIYLSRLGCMKIWTLKEKLLRGKMG
jgi:hypothetical protein